jgi:hypothetical protein
MTILLIISLISFAIIFVAQFIDLKRFKLARKNPIRFTVACAGSPNWGNRESRDVIFLDKNSLQTVDGHRIDISQYVSFIVSGNSMLLSGIKDGDLLLTKPITLQSANISFPRILVLERDKAAREDAIRKNDYALYKVRRTWCVCKASDDLENKLDDIIKSESFETLRRSFPGNFLDTNEMKQDFGKRLATFKCHYEDCENENSENNVILISTTLHTRMDSGYYNKVTFSIHPLRLVKGEVKHRFHLQKK